MRAGVRLFERCVRQSAGVDFGVVPSVGRAYLGVEGPMAVFRFIAFLLIVVALMLLGADVVSMLESGEPRLRSLEIVWALFATGGAEAFKAWASTTLPGPLPEGVATLLSWPAWAVLGVTGVLLAILFRQREDVYD